MKNAVKAGYDIGDSEIMYVVRARPPGVLGTHIGHVSFGDNKATMSYDGKVHRMESFKVLCRTYSRPNTAGPAPHRSYTV